MRRALSILLGLGLAITSHAGARALQPAECAAAPAIRPVVEAALREGGVQAATLPGGELNCPAVLTGAEKFVVTGIREDRLTGALEVRVECTPGPCLPFLVRVPVPGALAGNSFPRPAAEFSRLPGRTRKAAPAPSVVRPGQIVTLLWEQAGMRITRTVVCLDRGSEGQSVRTRSRDGGRIVRARVLSAGLVKADL